MLHPEQITGVVLAGGKSSRFGSNKALHKYGESDFLNHIINLIRPYSKEILIAGYYPEYNDIGIPVLEDEYPNIGPLGGIYTALKQCTTPWIMVLTCDMPLISSEVIMMMMASGSGESILGWHHESIFNTFPIIVSKEALPYIENAVQSGIYRIRQLFEWGISKKIRIPEPLLHKFANINTLDDYKDIIII